MRRVSLHDFRSRSVAGVKDRASCRLPEALLGSRAAEHPDQFTHQPGPAGLVTGTEAGSVVAVEVLVEEEMVTPVGILLEFFGAAIYRPAPLIVSQEDPCEPLRDLLGDLEQIHHPAGPGGTLNFEVVSVVQVEVQQRPNDQGVHRNPDRSPPVRVPSKHPAVRFTRQVVHAVFLPVDMEAYGCFSWNLDRDRIPYGLRNSCSSSIFVSMRRSRSGVIRARIPRSATPRCPGPVGWTDLAQFRHLRQTFLVEGNRFRDSFPLPGSMTVVAHNGSSPTIDLTFNRIALPSGSRSTS